MKTNLIKRNNDTAGLQAGPVTGWVDHLLQDNLNRFFTDDFWGVNGPGYKVGIPVNLRETAKSYELEMVAPGLRKEDFKLNVSNEMLTIAYESQKEKNQEENKEGWLRKEYMLHSFTRSFNLDDSVDVNKITAAYRNGILFLSLPKKESAQKLSRTIEII